VGSTLKPSLKQAGKGEKTKTSFIRKKSYNHTEENKASRAKPKHAKTQSFTGMAFQSFTAKPQYQTFINQPRVNTSISKTVMVNLRGDQSSQYSQSEDYSRNFTGTQEIVNIQTIQTVPDSLKSKNYVPHKREGHRMLQPQPAQHSHRTRNSEITIKMINFSSAIYDLPNQKNNGVLSPLNEKLQIINV
jgi:hypothetical protein